MAEVCDDSMEDPQPGPGEHRWTVVFSPDGEEVDVNAEEYAARELEVGRVRQVIGPRIVIETPEGIKFYQLCVHCSRLDIELRTGMTAAVNTLASAKAKYGHHFPGGIGSTRKKVRANLELLKERVLAGEVVL